MAESKILKNTMRSYTYLGSSGTTNTISIDTSSWHDGFYNILCRHPNGGTGTRIGGVLRKCGNDIRFEYYDTHADPVTSQDGTVQLMLGSWYSEVYANAFTYF